MDKDSPQRFGELLPFYLNGTLADDERHFVERWLSDHPEAQRELRFAERIRQEVRHTGQQRPAAAGLESLLATYRAERKPEKKPDGLFGWLAGGWRIPAPALAVATLILVGQSVWILSHLPQPESELGITGLHGRALRTPSSVVKVVFKPEARQSEVLSLLREIEATVVSGPSPAGELWLSIPPEKLPEPGISSLRASPLVASAEISDIPR